MTATREVVRLCKAAAGAREVAVEDDGLLDALAPAADPALELVKQQSRDEFATAFRAAVAALAPRDRRLLRHQLLDGLDLDAIAKLFDVHRTTASRWLAAARDQLLAGTRAQLASRLAMSAGEVDSLLRLVHSRLDVSLEKVLR